MTCNSKMAGRKSSFSALLQSSRINTAVNQAADDYRDDGGVLSNIFMPETTETKGNTDGGGLGKRDLETQRGLFPSDKNERRLKIKKLLIEFTRRNKQFSAENFREVIQKYFSLFKSPIQEIYMDDDEDENLIADEILHVLNDRNLFKRQDKGWEINDEKRADRIVKEATDVIKRNLDELEKFKSTHDVEFLQKQAKKRRYVRNMKKYSQIVELLEHQCNEYSSMLKNPFANIKDNSSNEEVLKILGNPEKIVGILQCYNFFAPLIHKGMKGIKSKQNQNALQSFFEKMATLVKEKPEDD